MWVCIYVHFVFAGQVFFNPDGGKKTGTLSPAQAENETCLCLTDISQ